MCGNYQEAIPIYRLSTQTVGVIGIGRIGSAYAERMKAFGMKVIAYDEYARKAGKAKDYMEMVSLSELLERSDIISIHCPFGWKPGFDCGARAEKDEKTAYLVNVSRGRIVNERDLYEALRDGEDCRGSLRCIQSGAGGQRQSSSES